MSEEELKETIEKYKSISGTNKVWLVDENFMSEYKRQIKADTIDEYKTALKAKIEHECKYLSDGGCTTTEYLDPYYIDTVAERLKEQKEE